MNEYFRLDYSFGCLRLTACWQQGWGLCRRSSKKIYSENAILIECHPDSYL